MVVRVPELLKHVLANPKAYPGEHNSSQQRTSKGFQRIVPERQLSLIFGAIVARLRELLEAGDSVSIPSLGTFSFAPVWHGAKHGPDYVSKTPTFVPSSELKVACPSYHGKELLNVDRGAISAAQSVPGKVKYLNEVPIASGCFYTSRVVKDAIKQVFRAVVDLADRGYDIDLDMGVVKFRVLKRSCQAVFDPKMIEKHSVPARAKSGSSSSSSPEKKQLSQTWQKPAFSKTMATFLERPNSREEHEKRLATANVGTMGRDLTSCK